MEERRFDSRSIAELTCLVDGVMVLDKNERIVAFSEGAERITGYAAGEVVGRTCQEVFRSDRCEASCPARHTIESGVVLSNHRCHILAADDREIEIAINISPLKRSDGGTVGAVIVFRNLKEMLEMTFRMTELSREILREKAWTDAIMNSIADGVITLAGDSTITSFNRSAERITGYSAEEVLGRPCHTVFRSRGCEEACPVSELMHSGKTITETEMEITSKDGTLIPVSISAAILRDENNQAVGAVESFRDLSRYKILTEELKGKYSFRNIIGKSHEMREVYQLIRSVARTNVTVLIQGDTGTGKELVARAIHYESPRAEQSFVVVHCAALPETLLESELFGHVRGAFTGATSDRKGRFQLADRGTLFLDEISEVSPATQVKLLRVLENKQFERVGDSRTVQVDVRLVCATNRNLKQMVGEGKFREDLYYLINVVSLKLPPLRERDEDIPLLMEHFIAKFNRETGKGVEKVHPDAMDMLIDYAWPGNVRELENAIGHAFVHCRGDTILPEHLPQDMFEAGPPGTETVLSVPAPLEEVEKAAIARMLKSCKGNQSKTAKRLGIGRSSLWRKIKKYGLADLTRP
jgi:PAS domain S-box-containing protein